MRRWSLGVNVSARRALAVSAVALMIVALAGCREQRAERLYREAGRSVERGDLGAAVERFERILAEFPGTRAAARAKSDVILYRGLFEASKRYPVRRAGDLLIQAARAVERFHQARESLPATLRDLVPAYLPSDPLDPWGKPLEYRRTPEDGYTLSCRGADGAEGGTGENADLVVRDGKFVEGSPEEIR
jgi:general secretion pathway protein G